MEPVMIPRKASGAKQCAYWFRHVCLSFGAVRVWLME